MKKFLIVLILGIAALVWVSTGCGGDDGSTRATAGGASSSSEGEVAEVTETTVTTSSRSRRDFVQLANSICKRADANRAQEIIQYAKEHQDEVPGGIYGERIGIEAFRAVVVPEIPARVEQLRALGAPEGDEQRIEAFLDSLLRIANAPPRLLYRELGRSVELARASGIEECA